MAAGLPLSARIEDIAAGIHHSVELILGAADKSGNRILQANLGFGADSQTYYSQPSRFEPGRWRHIGFTYDGAGAGRCGSVLRFRGGTPGSRQPSR